MLRKEMVSRMTSSAIDRISMLRKLNSDNTWTNRDLYRLLLKKDLYVLAYEQVKSNSGYMTQGTDGQTLDGMSLDLVEDLIKELRTEEYQPKPARRIYIPKSNGKMRPLGIPCTRDKLVQQVVKIILIASTTPRRGLRSQRTATDSGRLGVHTQH